MKLIFLHGRPGGKLTVARQLEILTGFKLFHNHLTVDLVGSVFQFGSQPFVGLREIIWLEVFSQASSAGLDGLIFTFAYDRSVRKSFIENVRSLLILEFLRNGSYWRQHTSVQTSPQLRLQANLG